MTEDEFISELIDRHNNADVDSKSIKDIRNVVRNMTEAARQWLFEKYIDNWKAKWIPSPAQFREWLKDGGKSAPKETLNGAWVCGSCKTKYSLDSQGCPRCGATAVDSVYPDGADPRIVDVKQDCWQCAVYKADVDQKYGPACKEWGKGSMPHDYCGKCHCRRCCIFEHSYRREPKKVTIEDMPWIRGGIEK